MRRFPVMTADFPALTLAHLNLDIADLDRSERFYRDVLAFPVTRRSDSLLVRWAGGLIVLAAGVPNPTGTFHFGFRVATESSVDEWFDRFASVGVPIVEKPAGRGAVYVGRILDPDGYAIEVYAERVEA
jgi:catechol 2,3-dioxygenase-like lactoylglutathione lyase family enzyme